MTERRARIRTLRSGARSARAQSTTSIRRLLRDPAGFVWRYALGWQAPELEEQPLVLSRPVFGELVHELIRRAIDALEPAPGVSRASETEIENAVRRRGRGRRPVLAARARRAAAAAVAAYAGGGGATDGARPDGR